MDKDAVNKVVAAILAGQAVAVTNSSKHTGALVDKYLDILNEIKDREEKKSEEERAENAHNWSKALGN
jgi:hypothetical protein